MTKTLTTLAYEAGLSPFNPTVVLHGDVEVLGQQAATLLVNRNRYFDKEYRERYNVQVHRIETSRERLALGCVESAQQNGKTKRRYRAVLFRCDGNVIYQTPDNRVLQYREACIDMRYWLTHINEAKLLTDLCKMQAKSANLDFKKAEQVLASIQAGQAP